MRVDDASVRRKQRYLRRSWDCFRWFGEDPVNEVADKQLTRDPGVLVLQLLALRWIQVGQNRV